MVKNNKIYIFLLMILVTYNIFAKSITPCDVYKIAEQAALKYPYYVNDKKYFINPALIIGLVDQESSFETEARSAAGAYGLTQIMPKTAEILKCDYSSLNNPTISVECSIKFLAALLTYNKGDLVKTLSGYNGGTYSTEKNATDKNGVFANRIYDNPETKKYVVKVLQKFERYKKLDCK